MSSTQTDPDPRFKAPDGALPVGFRFPGEYLEYLLFDEEESNAAGGFTTLSFTWPSSLNDSYYRIFEELYLAPTSWQQQVRHLFGSRSTKFVHIGSENDRHYFFIADQGTGIAFLDLGENSRRAVRTHHANVLELIFDLRNQYSLPKWFPKIR